MHGFHLQSTPILWPKTYQFRLNGASSSGNRCNYSILKVQRQLLSQVSQVLLEKEEKVFVEKDSLLADGRLLILRGKGGGRARRYLTAAYATRLKNQNLLLS